MTTMTKGFTDISLSDLVGELPLRQESIRLYGKDIPTPRLTSWHGDGGYTFSGKTLEPNGWTPLLSQLLDLLEQETGVRFNSVLCNLYRDGSDSVSWHADDEPEVTGPIASVSIGDNRTFKIRNNETREVTSYQLGGGSLLVMPLGLQQTHQHCVPKTKKPVGPRLNLTFRVLR